MLHLFLPLHNANDGRVQTHGPPLVDRSLCLLRLFRLQTSRFSSRLGQWRNETTHRNFDLYGIDVHLGPRIDEAVVEPEFVRITNISSRRFLQQHFFLSTGETLQRDAQESIFQLRLIPNVGERHFRLVVEEKEDHGLVQRNRQFLHSSFEVCGQSRRGNAVLPMQLASNI